MIYYALSVEELAIKLVKENQLSELKQERLFHECIPEVRSYLDVILAADHLIALLLIEQAKIDFLNGFSILL